MATKDPGPHMRPRMERVEELLKKTRALAFAAAAVSSISSFAGPVVANQAAATALPLTTYTNPRLARQVYTLAQEAIWQYIPGVLGTVGVPPLAADEVITAANGVLARTSYSSPKWRIGVNDVYIDPANVNASNENAGFDPALPLLTAYELHRRRGWDDSKPIVGPNLATSPDGYSNIHIQSDVVAPDQLPIKVTVAKNSQLRVQGNTPTLIRSAVLTDAVVAMNPAVPLGGTRLQVRDNTLANWTAFMVPNRRVRMIDGPAAGGTFQPQTNQAGGAVDCSPCQTTNGGFPAFSTVPTTVTPAVGNTYNVESLTVCNFGEIDVAQENNDAFVADTFFDIVNVNLPSLGQQSWRPQVVDSMFINLYQCTIDRSMFFDGGTILAIACYFGAVALIADTVKSTQGLIAGGGANGAIASGGPGGILQIVLNGNTAIESLIDFNFCSNIGIAVITGGIRGAAFWNALVLAGVNTAGHGLIVGGGGTGPFFGFRGSLLFKSTVWGNTTSAAATGCLVSATCNGVGSPQNITGPTSDFKLANKIVGWWFNDAIAAYNPIGGSVATTWAALAAAEGAAGFGGNAHELDSNTHFVAVETTG
jgi:hypothetical protein